MKRLTIEILAATGILLVSPSLSGLSAEARIDPRMACLNEFLGKKNLPVHKYSEDFIKAADQNSLDWRLLPSISIVESTGGKHYKNNNVFGWNNGEKRFHTVQHGIYRVAHHLKHSRHYRGKDVRKKLATYNPNPEYSSKVLAVMRQMGPATFRSRN